MKFSAVILAGGASRRMGQDKAWLQVNGESLIMRQLSFVKSLRPVELFISGRPEADYSPTGCPVLLDCAPSCGPLAGVERALACTASNLVFVVPVDVPFVKPSTVFSLLNLCTETTGALPAVHGRIEPLIGFYPTSAHSLVIAALQEGRYMARDFASRCSRAGLVELREFDPEESRQFANWNCPEDLASVRG